MMGKAKNTIYRVATRHLLESNQVCMDDCLYVVVKVEDLPTEGEMRVHLKGSVNLVVCVADIDCDEEIWIVTNL
jgi:hypothetical protein